MASGLEELGIIDDSDEQAAPAPGSAEQAAAIEDEAAAASDRAEQDAHLSKVEEILGAVRLFEGLLPTHLRRIAALAREREFGRGEHIFHHGDDGDGLYLVLEGAVRISRNVSGMGEEALAILRAGQYFGEMSIVDDAPRSADAIAHERSRVLKLPKDDLRDLMFVDRELAYELLWRFVRTMSGRLRESNDRLLMLTISSKF